MVVAISCVYLPEAGSRRVIRPLDKTGAKSIMKTPERCGVGSEAIPARRTRPWAVFPALACGATPGIAHFLSATTTVAISCISLPATSGVVLEVAFWS